MIHNRQVGVTNGDIIARWGVELHTGMVFGDNGLGLLPTQNQATKALVPVLNRLTTESLQRSFQAHGSLKRTIFPIPLGFDAQNFTQLALQPSSWL